MRLLRLRKRLARAMGRTPKRRQRCIYTGGPVDEYGACVEHGETACVITY